MTPSTRGFIVGCVAAAGMLGFATAGLALLSPIAVMAGSIVIGLVGLMAAGIAGSRSAEMPDDQSRPFVIVSRRSCDPENRLASRAARAKETLGQCEAGKAPNGPMKMNPIDYLLSKVEFKCGKCGAKMGSCDCWERCSCGWQAEKGRMCGNPETKSCTSRVKHGKYNRRTKRWE